MFYEYIVPIAAIAAAIMSLVFFIKFGLMGVFFSVAIIRGVQLVYSYITWAP